MERLIVIDGNSILNRAFYGLMGNRILMTSDGTYTNAVYGFLSILFKILDDLKPEYIAVAFDLKAPTKRHKLYEGYKATRKGMPDELAMQLPILKEVLQAMNIKIIEKEGYEADDILGTLAKYGEQQGIKVTILSGDRDAFQLASDNITIRIPRTKMGKTEEEDFDRQKVIEIYGLEPEQLIEVKGLMGDSSDNIPGLPGVGEKTAIGLIKKYTTIEKLYEAVENGKSDLKGKLKENVENNKELAYISKTLGTIDVDVPIEKDIETLRIKQWDNQKVVEIFKALNFNRYIERFNLLSTQTENKNNYKEELFTILEGSTEEDYINLTQKIKNEKKLIYCFTTEDDNTPSNIINKKIVGINIYIENENTVYYLNFSKDIQKFVKYFKDIFESSNIEKYGYKIKLDYILLQQIEIVPTNFVYDVEIAGYLLNSNNSKYTIEDLSKQYLNIDINEYLGQVEKKDEQKEEKPQINLFETIVKEKEKSEQEKKNHVYAYAICHLYKKTEEELKQQNLLDLFNNIEMPTCEILAKMQYTGIYVDKTELIDYGKKIQEKIDVIIKEIYEIAGEEFNINSTKQLGEILFEKLQLPSYKKTKKGYSTDVEVLEKLKTEHPIINKILEYRQYVKLNSTYVEGMLPYINPITGKIHSYFHQTVTATGRISSTEPNLQNIPTKVDLGKQLRKAFKPKKGNVFIDADYSQIELRVLAHISNDQTMIEAFINDEDIHLQAASKVFGIPIEKVTKEQRSEAKAVNFGIVYGISDFGLSEQIGVSKKQAKMYIEQYLDKYKGIKEFMDNVTENVKQTGYSETLFNRRRYIPEINSNNYIVRQFGKRVALNTPIQGTAADIMKIAMINVAKKLKEENLKAEIVLQIHDELLIEAPENEKEKVKHLLKDCMENVVTLKVPLKVEIGESKNWYDIK